MKCENYNSRNHTDKLLIISPVLWKICWATCDWNDWQEVWANKGNANKEVWENKGNANK